MRSVSEARLPWPVRSDGASDEHPVAWQISPDEGYIAGGQEAWVSRLRIVVTARVVEYQL